MDQQVGLRTAASRQRPPRFPAMDGLRGVAAIGVFLSNTFMILFHIGPFTHVTRDNDPSRVLLFH